MSTERVELTKDELVERSKLLAQKIDEKIKLQDEKKEITSEFSTRIKAVELEIIELSNVVRSGVEYRKAQGLFQDLSENKELQ